MFIFYFLGVGLPCRSIFRRFWLCEEAQCVYLRRHLGSPRERVLHAAEAFASFLSAIGQLWLQFLKSDLPITVSQHTVGVGC